MLREVRLYGFLAKKYGKVHKLDVASPAEAVRALCSQFAGFKRHLLDFQGKGFMVFAGKGNVTEAELHMQHHDDKVFKIVPVLSGASDNPIVTIIIGIVLIAAAFISAGASLAALKASKFALATAKFGAAIALSGVFGLIAQPKKTSTKERKQSKSDLFQGAVNNASEGVPVPLIYGRHLVGSIVVSQGLQTQDAPPYR